jgi:hypothetical protein
LQSIHIKRSRVKQLLAVQLAWWLVVSGAHAWAIEITQPVKGAVVRPGSILKIKLSFPDSLPVTRVTYSVVEEDVALDDRIDPPPSVTADTTPFSAELPVSQEAIGPYRLLAVAEIKERRGSYVLFDETTIQIEPETAPTVLRAVSPVRFTKITGEVQWLSVRGHYPDRVVRDLTSGGTGTKYRSSDESIVRVNGDGRVQSVREGNAEIIAINHGKQVNIRIVVDVRDTENRPPVADAGPDQTVRQGAQVRLDAIRSADPEGENPFYYWSQVRGIPINLVEPLSLRPYFKAPQVDAPRVLRFRLIVKDQQEAESFPAYVNVTVTP